MRLEPMSAGGAANRRRNEHQYAIMHAERIVLLITFTGEVIYMSLHYRRRTDAAAFALAAVADRDEAFVAG